MSVSTDASTNGRTPKSDRSRAEIVPFGKYKGEPVERMAADADYCEWLTAQPWFKNKYTNVYNTIINCGTEPTDSPEHNEMQARFLDDQWCVRLGNRLRCTVDDCAHMLQRRRFESGGWDVEFSCCYRQILVECKPDLGDDYPSVLRQVLRHRVDPGANATRFVLVRRYGFERVTWEQVARIFAASGIRLVHERTLETG